MLKTDWFVSRTADFPQTDRMEIPYEVFRTFVLPCLDIDTRTNFNSVLPNEYRVIRKLDMKPFGEMDSKYVANSFQHFVTRLKYIPFSETDARVVVMSQMMDHLSQLHMITYIKSKRGLPNLLGERCLYWLEEKPDEWWDQSQIRQDLQNKLTEAAVRWL